MKSTVIAGALVAAFLGYVLVVVSVTDDDPAPKSAPQPWQPTTTTMTARDTGPGPLPYDEGATRGGDAAPHEAENRGGLQPEDLSDETRARLDAEGTALLPTLEQVRASGTITQEAVSAALVAAGYPRDHVSTGLRTLPSDYETTYVTFGIEVGDACVSGMVTPTQVQALGMGRVSGWECLPPDTH